jgi:hypothetical protein
MPNSAEAEWDEQPTHPESDDLGYELDDWERIRATGSDPEQYLYLPGDEELLRDEAFIIVPPEDIEDLVDNR